MRNIIYGLILFIMVSCDNKKANSPSENELAKSLDGNEQINSELIDSINVSNFKIVDALKLIPNNQVGEVVILLNGLNSKINSLYIDIDSLRLISKNQANEIIQLKALLQSNSEVAHIVEYKQSNDVTDYKKEIEELYRWKDKIDGTSSSHSSTDKLYNLTRTIDDLKSEISSMKSDIKNIKKK